ncbi:MAG TPA: AI-2E family transporter [Methanoregulaceae archaeon]|nr:AI-2E family transporter [Methanoregulaceae archaeon]
MSADSPGTDRYILYLFAAIAFGALIVFWQFLDALAFSVTIAVVMMPVHRRVSQKIGKRLSAALITVLAFLVFIGVIAFAGFLLYQNQEYISGLVSSTLAWVTPVQDGPLTSILHINATQISGILGGRDDFLAQLRNTLIQNAQAIGFKLVFFFLSFSLLIYKGDELYKSALAIIPGNLNHAIQKLTASSVDMLYAIYVVQVIIVIITALFAVPFFLILGYGHVMFFSSLAGLLKIVPVLGPSLLMAFLGVYAVSISDIRGVLLVIFVGYPIVCAVPDLFIRPVLMGRRTCIHPVIMWIGFFGGLFTMGLVGFVVGPLVLSLLINGYHVMKEDRTVCELEKGEAG